MNVKGVTFFFVHCVNTAFDVTVLGLAYITVRPDRCINSVTIFVVFSSHCGLVLAKSRSEMKSYFKLCVFIHCVTRHLKCIINQTNITIHVTDSARI